MPDFTAQKDFTNRENRFMRHCGIHITRLEEGLCQAELDTAEYCKNTGDTVHGGLLYTMADCVVSAYARALRERPVTLSGSLNYLANVTEGTLTATAVPVKTGKTILVFSAAITCGDKLLAQGSFSCYSR